MSWRDIVNEPDLEFRFCVLGEPVSHSLSPLMQNKALEYLRVNGRYEAIHVSSDEFHECVQHLIRSGFKGVNVTLPHKSLAAGIAEIKHEDVQILGVANCLLFADKIHAKNTDVEGFYKPISHLKPSSAIVLGAGGASLAVCYALLKKHWRVKIYNRTIEKSEQIKQRLNEFGEIEVLKKPSPLECTLVVNATSLGLKQDEAPELMWDEIHHNTTLYDLVYRESDTLFLRKAKNHELNTIDGREMLVEQGALSLEWWTGKHAPREIMRKAIGL